MHFLRFFRFALTRFPVQVIALSVLMLLAGVFEFGALCTLAPVVDLMLHPNQAEASAVSAKIFRILEWAGLPVTVWVVLLVFFLFNLTKSLLVAASRWCAIWADTSVFETLAAETYDALFTAKWAMFMADRQGRFLNTLTREIFQVGLAFQFAGILFSDMTLCLFCILVALTLSWKVALVGVAAGVVLAIPFFVVSKTVYRLGKKTTASANDLVSMLSDNLSGAKVIMGFGNQVVSAGYFKRAMAEYSNAYLKSNLLRLSAPVLFNPCGIIAVAVSLYATQWFAVPLSETAVVLYALWKSVPYVTSITGSKNGLANRVPSLEQVLNIIDDTRRHVQKSGTKPFAEFKDSILLNDVSSSYPERGNVLSNVTVSIPKGCMIGIVGSSGSGKSTLIDVVMGFHESSEGSVTIDGIPLFDYDIVSYRKRIGYVPQDPVLFNGTIRENLIWAKPDATQKEIVEACDLANATEFIEPLLQGYDTAIGDRGVRLSGGQCQRLALARAILRKPELLILDEATSSLDSASEKLIQRAIEQVAGKTTLVVVAHRLSTIAHSDRIYVLDKGRIVEQGTCDELVRNGGRFANMVHLQSTHAEVGQLALEEGTRS